MMIPASPFPAFLKPINAQDFSSGLNFKEKFKFLFEFLKIQSMCSPGAPHTTSGATFGSGEWDAIQTNSEASPLLHLELLYFYLFACVRSR